MATNTKVMLVVCCVDVICANQIKSEIYLKAREFFFYMGRHTDVPACLF